MANSGWNMPPGCFRVPGDDTSDLAVSELVENILAMLEKFGVPAPINDQIVKLIEDWENRDQSADGDTLPEDREFWSDWEDPDGQENPLPEDEAGY